LTSIARGKSVFCGREANLDEDVIESLLNIHLKALFETIINELPKECHQIKTYWDEFNLDELFASVICKDNDDIMKHLDITSILDGLAPREVIGVLKDLVTNNKNVNIDGIKMLIKVAHPYLKKKISTNLKNSIDLNEMTITIRNIRLKQKIPKEVEYLYQKYNLGRWNDNQIIPYKRGVELFSNYGFGIAPYEIIIGMPQLYELLLKVTYYDERAMSDLLRLLLPIFRDIRGAQEILNISRI
jgi:hypothetical protein